MLPPDDVPLPRSVLRELRNAAPSTALAKDIIRAVGGARGAAEAGDWPRAAELLAWARDVAPRSAVVREALGIARYNLGEFDDAAAELGAYRRMTGRVDQNHLIADCARAAGRADKVRTHVLEMADAGAPADRLAEAWIVLAGALADSGDLRGARELLDLRADLEPSSVGPEHLRLWYVAGDLAERSGDLPAAREWFGAILSLDEDFADAADRAEAIGA